MKWRKFIIFSITILSISLVVFNNLSQITQLMFTPEINLDILTFFALITLGVITYIVVNKDMLN